MTTAVVGVLLLAGCGGTSVAGEPAPSESPSQEASPATPVWPDPAQTVVTTPHGTREPAEPVDLELMPEIAWLAQDQGISVEQAAVELQDQLLYGPWAERAQQLLGAQYSQVAWRDPDDPDARPYVAYRGDLPPALVTLAEELPFPVELRGGAVLTDQEREVVQRAALDAFEAEVAPRNWGGGMDALTGRISIDYVPEGAKKRADDTTTRVVLAAARTALGRDAPITVEFLSDDRDPLTTQPATWFLPAGFVPDPAATSVEVLVEEDGCTSGEGAAGNTAEPVVELTGTQVRIAVSTYIRKGGQTCPGHPLAPVVVQLGQPLGDRQLVDVNGAIDDDLAPRGGGVVVPAAG